MYCNGCGNKIDIDAKFCNNCGKALNDTSNREVTISDNNKNSNQDLGNNGYYILGLFLPFLSLILAKKWENVKPISLKQLIVGSYTFLLMMGLFILKLFFDNYLINSIINIVSIYVIYKMIMKVNKEKGKVISNLSKVVNHSPQTPEMINLMKKIKSKSTMPLKEKICLIGAIISMGAYVTLCFGYFIMMVIINIFIGNASCTAKGSEYINCRDWFFSTFFKEAIIKYSFLPALMIIFIILNRYFKTKRVNS